EGGAYLVRGKFTGGFFRPSGLKIAGRQNNQEDLKNSMFAKKYHYFSPNRQMKIKQRNQRRTVAMRTAGGNDDICRTAAGTFPDGLRLLKNDPYCRSVKSPTAMRVYYAHTALVRLLLVLRRLS
ncbi:MAG: hypothetical protein LZF61_01070, partial [Nitrosomonas sp.]